MVDYFRESQDRIRQRVRVLTALKVYQEIQEKKRLIQCEDNEYKVVKGHIDGPRAYEKITAFELWREILMYL